MRAGDSSTAVVRRYHAIVATVIIDQGGADLLSEARLQLIHRFAATAVLAEQMEARIACGEEINMTQHALLCTTMVRIAQIIGIDRAGRNRTPRLTDYLRSERMEESDE